MQTTNARETIAQIQEIFADDKGWDSEDDMLKDMAEFRRNSQRNIRFVATDVKAWRVSDCHVQMMSAETDEEFNANMQKGYDDIVQGRVQLLKEAFADIKQRFTKCPTEN